MPHMLKKFVVLSVLALGLFILPSPVRADEEIICPQPYGGGVVCGIKHEPVETGLGENLVLVGALALSASGLLLYFAKRNSNSIKLS